MRKKPSDGVKPSAAESEGAAGEAGPTAAAARGELPMAIDLTIRSERIRS